MKVYINIITNTQIAEIQETYPNFDGSFTISGEVFIPGEWKHVADSFVIPDNRKPFIKEVRWIIRYLVRKFLRENNLHQFAAGLLEAAENYSWAAGDKTVANAVIALAPEEEVPE